MFRKPPISSTTKSAAATELWQGFVINLDEHRQESLSGGITITPDPNLIFKIKYPSQRFPCDGPGRGGTCD